MKLSLTLFRLSKRLVERLDHYGRYNPSPLTIQHFVEFGKQNVKASKSFIFLRKEIPVRLANIMNEIKLLPEILLEMPSVKEVTGWYEQSFEEVLEFEDVDVNNMKYITRFSEQLDHIQRRHVTVVETMAKGIIEMKQKAAADPAMAEKVLHNIEDRVQYFLDRFYLMRISIRMLIHQHLLLYGEPTDKRHIGCFDQACDVIAVAKDAYENARFLCEQYYGQAPECHFHSVNRHGPDSIIMTYVPAHLYYMLFELMKNSLRAVVEFHSESHSLPPINLLVCKGREDVAFKLSDQGGGVPRREIDKLFKYMYSTAPKPPSPDAIDSTPIAGYGYGLPIARLYARYFNGDLSLNSVDGYGTDAMIYLKVFPRDAAELLPVYNKTSSQHYVASRSAADWTEPSGFNRY